MPLLDFKEIALPTHGADRDQFELLARDFLEMVGFRIIIQPDRGADGGRDLIVEERRLGPGGETIVKWLVSCKHKAHSGATVTPADEADILDRIVTHGCHGFIGFYSTLPSSGLAQKFNTTTKKFEVNIYDKEKIEKELLSTLNGLMLVKRYFPHSHEKWTKKQKRTHAKIFSEEPNLSCLYCDKSLLLPEPSGIMVVWKQLSRRSGRNYDDIRRVYWCCKGDCDRRLKARYYKRGLIDGWKDISDIAMPVEYIHCVMAILNGMKSGDRYTQESFDNIKNLLLNIFPLVSRDMTEEEGERRDILRLIPECLGGLG